MTITYSGNFVKCLFRWKGSVWKAVWRDLLIWLCCYTALHMALFYFLPNYGEKIRALVKVFEEYTKKLPVEFLLGFYVGQVVKRWWEQVKSVPWPDDVIAIFTVFFHGNDEDSRSKRRAAGRYTLLSIILALYDVSSHLKKKFPAFQPLVECGLMTSYEHELLIKAPFDRMRWELPLQWIQQIVRTKVGLGADEIPPMAALGICQELNKLRASLRLLTTYNWIVLPLVYTQTVTVAVYGYFMFCFMGHQFTSIDQIDFFITFLTILQFVFYVGWLKVAEVLHKPFGDDDDDVDLSLWLERHVRATFAMTDYATRVPIVVGKETFSSDVIASLFAKPELSESTTLLGTKK